MKLRDYYTILGVDRSASGDEIKGAFRRLAQRFHPDVTIDPDGEAKFKAVAEAYRTLRRPDTRSAYNRKLLHLQAGGESAWPVQPIGLWFAFFPWPVWAFFWRG
jgi:curved DNA-binding protein